MDLLPRRRSKEGSELTAGGGHARAFVVGMVAGGALMFFFSGLIVKIALLGALVVLAVVLARVF